MDDSLAPCSGLLSRRFLGRLAAVGGLSLALAAPGLGRAATTGPAIYAETCAACHQPTGQGIKGAFPALAGSKVVLGPAPILAATVLNGRGAMPPFKSQLNDAQLAAVMTYMRASWGNRAKPVTVAQVATARAAPAAKRVQAH